MQEKESVNFFYYLNPIQIKKKKKKESKGEKKNNIKQKAKEK